MRTRAAALLSVTVAMVGCASINPFEYTGNTILRERQAIVCWAKFGAAREASSCEDEPAKSSVKECVVELRKAASLFTGEEHKRSMLSQCMLEKGWQKIYLEGVTLAVVRYNYSFKPTADAAA